MELLFFDNWDGIIRTGITTILAYALVVLMLRISGKRTLAKMNAFDTVVTIALGSILGSVILSKSTPLAEGLLAIALLIILQYAITFISVRSRFFKVVVSSNPTLLFYEGKLLHDQLKRERVSQEEINKSIRQAGYTSMEKIRAIIIESTGDITVIDADGKTNSMNAMEDISNFDRER